MENNHPGNSHGKIALHNICAAHLIFIACIALPAICANPAQAQTNGVTNNSFVEGRLVATINATTNGNLRTYELASNAELRDNRPAGNKVTFSESPSHAHVRTGNLMFDGLYALAVNDAIQNSVSQIRDHAYGNNEPIQIDAFQTGEFWTYVWTRDISYSTYLALASFDPQRAENSLAFKTSELKPSVTNGYAEQIIQDTGSGGSYPISSDRIVWILGASETLKYLPESERQAFLAKVYTLLSDTIEQDRRLIFDETDGLYRGEQSFLDWREQTYPGWTKDNVKAIGMSKALSVNAAYYFALNTASEYAGQLGHGDEQVRYAAWAKELKAAINKNFYDPDTGLYSTCLFTDEAQPVRIRRYDLLGESLAILLGVADDASAQSILSHYPTGPYGPPVVWPQEMTVPIYHNDAIWPFVTAYWTKAARKVSNTEAVNEGVHSLMRGAAFNLSNMENFDFEGGRAQVKTGPLQGPVINSRRQLWSVAGYLSMVQDVIFGLETSLEGIRFEPFITADMRNGMFASTDRLELLNFTYLGRAINVSVHLPPVGINGDGTCHIDRFELNGKQVGDEFLSPALLQNQNQLDVYLLAPGNGTAKSSVRLITDTSDERALFGPLQPEWLDVGQGGITVENGLLVLHYTNAPAPNLVFNIYRDGKPAAKNVTTLEWTDPQSADYTNTTHFYVVEALDAKTGNVSHLTTTRYYAGDNNHWMVPARDMTNRGGQLAEGRYFMNWGKPDDRITGTFTAKRSGHYMISAQFSNGAGPVNTGITCAIKKIEIRQKGSDAIVAEGYFIMPQSGNWQRYDISSSIPAELKAGQNYTFRISEDEYSHNMSYLAHNERYTSGDGGGDSPYNYVNIAGLELLHVSE
jgi:hypothetical protein